jgi:hypothetical protein
MENDEMKPSHGVLAESLTDEQEALLCALDRIAVAIERIERTLDRRPARSRRQHFLVKLLGEAPRVARALPAAASDPEAPDQWPGPPSSDPGPHGPGHPTHDPGPYGPLTPPVVRR